MSSLTTISSSMEAESPEEVVDTRLSLVIGAGSRPPPVQALLPPDDQAPVRKKKGESTRGTSNTTTSKPSKRTKTMNGDDDGGDTASGGARKKLRLTTEQAALLEDSFRAHNVLSHDEKHDLARRLRLSARQVEVWFQNRRARTKLKQTELDCELLRRWCERLSDENARLRRDIAEARSSSAAVSRLITMVNDVACSTSCNKLAGGGRMAA